MSKWLKMLLTIIAILFVFAAPKAIEYIALVPKQAQDEIDLRFTGVTTELEFTHKSDFVAGLPFMTLSTIDLGGDGIDKLFVGGGIGQQGALQEYKNKRFVSIPLEGWFTKNTEYPTSGASSIDVNNEGKVNLFFSLSSGLYLYALHSTGKA